MNTTTSDFVLTLRKNDTLKATMIFGLGTRDLKIKKNKEFLNRIWKSTVYDLTDKEDKTQNFAYIAVSDGGEKYDFIEMMDSHYKGYNICEGMIYCYQDQFKKQLVPYEIIKDSAMYWLKLYYSEEASTFDKLMERMTKNLGVRESDVVWGPLKNEYKLLNKFTAKYKGDDIIGAFRKHKALILKTLKR